MRWGRVGIELEGDDGGAAELTGSGPVGIGPFEIALHDQAPGEWPTTSWSITNRGDAPASVRSVSLVHHLEADGALDLFVNGYQSWSATGARRVTEASDPSRAPDSIELVRALHHADQSVAPAGSLRSEAVAVLADQGPTRLLVGFEAGKEHDGTVWLRQDGAATQVVTQAYLGGATLAPGETRPLHGVVMAEGPDASSLLESWATYAGAVQNARTSAPFQVGWCSWYHYFHGVTEDDLRSNLGLASDWPFDVFQLDDGFQPAIGDWLVTNDRFPSELDRLAGDIDRAGFRPGVWIAPFLVAPESQVARDHPEWIAEYRPGRPLVGNVEPGWGGAVWTLDTTNPEVLAHLEHVARSLVDAGFTYLKLDFTYAPAIDGVYADPSRTPAQRVRAGYDAIRRGAGEAAFLLGCGAPLGCTVGAVDGMRIGPDVAPYWAPERALAGYDDTGPATRNAWRNTLARSFMHRRLWVNDPDCLMLRTAETRLSPEAVETWARAVGVSGGMALVSDDLALLGAGERALLDRVLGIGRASDAEAMAARPARCLDLLDPEGPRRLATADYVLDADLESATSTLTRRLDVA
jgi:alpha-galactosidase